MKTTSVKNLIKQQFDSLRYDLIVKYMLIEELDGKGDKGIDLYSRMYTLVEGNKVDTRLKLLKEMLNTFSPVNYPIVLNKTHQIRDGSHRLAMACYLGHSEIAFKITRRGGRGLSKNALEKVCSAEEMNLIENKKIEILNKLGAL